jgi:hypothetical protein
MIPGFHKPTTPTTKLREDQIPDITGLEELLLGPVKELLSVPAKELGKFTQLQRQVFCSKYGIYQLLTDELVAFLRDEIDEQAAIEIGAGNGALGNYLPDLICTDSYVQQDDLAIRAHYATIGSVPVAYGAHVLKYDALRAVDLFQPKVVIGCWVTEKGTSGPTFMHGIDELAMLDPKRGVTKYLMVGNKRIHGQKAMLKAKHLKPKHFVAPDWLFSRASHPEDNVIYRITHR